MVRLEEVDDEEVQQGQDGPIGGEDDWDTDSASDASETSSIASLDDISSETVLDRLLALQDMLPPSQRRFLTSSLSTSAYWLKSGLTFSGKALWVVSTSLLLLGVPWAMAYADEQQMIEMEKEMQMQQRANEILTSPSGGAVGGEARPAI